MREPNLKSVGERITPQSWLRAPRLEEPTIIIIHATRGKNTPGLQYLATKNWVRSVYNQHDNFSWGSSCDFIVGNEPGEIAQVGTLSYRANWSAGYGHYGVATWGADTKAISIEVAQSADMEDYDPDAINNLLDLCEELVKFYNIPIQRITYLSQTHNMAKGFVGHEDTANGRYYGKTDPGDKFPWDDFLRRLDERVNKPKAAKPAPSKPKEEEKVIGPNDGHNARNDFTDVVLEMYNGEPPWDKKVLDEFLKKWGYLFR